MFAESLDSGGFFILMNGDKHHKNDYYSSVETEMIN